MNPTHNPTTLDPTTADLLRRAADHIDRYGFHQGSYYDNPISEYPATCAAGALAIAAFGEPIPRPNAATGPGAIEHVEAFYWFQEYLYANVGTYWGEPIGIYAWSDSPDTTGIDVIDMLRAAADAWDAQNTGGDPS